ncbi:MAG: PKD domain-containing protein, partial [Bacteroidia bacterium]|nr:PKD domain-containing protein [Bacteroidia bacterium]
FNIQHFVRSALSCADTTSVVYIVHPSPTASFTAADRFICFNFPFNFTNTSSIPAGTLSYKWDLNDGTSSDSADIKDKYYSKWGSYYPSLIATSDLMCSDTVSLKVEVAPKPSSSFNRTTDSAQCLKNNSYSFLNTSTVDSGSIVSNKWNLGDGSAIAQSLNLNNHVYAQDSSYTITLIIESNQGCIDTSTKVASIWPQAQVSFSVNDSGQCFNDQLFNFTNESKISKGTLSYQWILGNGNTDTTTNVNGEKYALGTNIVRLVSTSNQGCKDTLDRRIIVHPNTQPNFDIDTLFGCFKSNQFTFNNRSTLSKGTMNIRWDFGDSTFNTIANTVTKKFSRPDTFIIELMTVTNMDCFDSTSKSVIVHHDPKADFSLNTDRFCFNNQQFSAFNISSIVSGTETAQIHWGDNTKELIGDTLVHTYDRADSFKISVVSTSDNLCKDTMDLFVIVDSMPTANFTISQANQCFTGNDFRFTNTSSSHMDTLSYTWNLGDGSTSSSNDIDSKSYSNHDSMIVKLVATNIFSCMDSISKPIIVYPQPEAAFSISDDRQCFDQHTFDFTNTSKANVGVNTTQWTFNFGLLDTNTNITNWTWNTSDTFAVRQLVTNSSGCIDSLVKQIIIDPEPTVAFAINDNRQCFNNNSFTQINLSTANVGTNSYSWDMGDKASFTSTDVVNYSYGTFDTFTIKLIATNGEGCLDSASQTVIVDKMPEATFTIDDVEQCLQSNNYQYTNTSTAAFGTLTNTWTLESLGKINRENIDTNYTSADTFTVKLVVENLTGCLDSISKEVIVRPMPTANFTISDVAQCFKNNTVDFTNTTTIKYGALNHQWFLGDGDTSTTLSITNKNFGTADTFYNKLVSISTFGCEDTIIKEIYVHPNPQANFAINDDGQCFSKQSFNYTNTSVVQYNKPMTFSWNLGDARIRASQDVNNLQYLNPGTYTVLLEAMSDLNCPDTLSKVIVVLKKPVAGFTTRDSSQCLVGNSFNMDNTSTADIGNVTSVWNLQDGTRFTSDDINNKSFDRDGVYTVQLIVEDAATCKDTFVNNVIVHPHPVAIIQASSTCINEPFTISAASTIKNTAIVKTTRDFGDSTQASTSNPAKYFGNAANYLVRLTEESDQGCKHDTSQMVTVWAKPNAQFTSTKFKSGISEVEYQYTDQSTTTINQWLWEFGDGQISNSQNPLITYSDTGTFFTQLIVRN